jgi:hypothetical protein
MPQPIAAAPYVAPLPGGSFGGFGGFGDFGSIIGALSGISGAFGGGSSKKDAKNLQERQYVFNRTYDRYAISRRVWDAKDRGIHPLAALGISPAGGVVGIPGISSQGQNGIQAAGDAIKGIARSRLSAFQKQVQQAELQRLQAQANADNAQAMYYASEAARNRQQDIAQPATTESTSSAAITKDAVQSVPMELAPLNMTSTPSKPVKHGHLPSVKKITFARPNGEKRTIQIGTPGQAMEDSAGETWKLINEMESLGYYVIGNWKKHLEAHKYNKHQRRFGSNRNKKYYSHKQGHMY